MSLIIEIYINIFLFFDVFKNYKCHYVRNQFFLIPTLFIICIKIFKLIKKKYVFFVFFLIIKSYFLLKNTKL